MVKNQKKLAAKPTAKKPAAKPAAKKSVKTTVKKVVNKTAKKTVKKITKKVVKKAAAKTAKTVKAVVRKTVVKKTAVKKVAPAPVSPTPAVSLKGMRGVSGAKAARIAQIVAESFLPKPTVAKPASPSTPPGAGAQAGVKPAAEAAPQSASTNEPGSALDAALITAKKAAAVLFSKKAEDVVLMDLRNLSTVADYYLIATCQNEPQMRSILGTVQRILSRDGIKSLRSEYMPGVRWAVVDYGDMILHLFEKQTRGFYSLERLWADAPSTPLKASDYALPADADDDGIDADEDGDL